MALGSDQRELSTAEPPRRRPTPKRFVKNQIPESITGKRRPQRRHRAPTVQLQLRGSQVRVWRVLSTGAKRVALQFPEGLLMYSLVLSDILFAYAAVDACFVLGDVTYGACCVDDLSALALGADLLIHYGHSCLVPIDATAIPCLYVFVDIASASTSRLRSGRQSPNSKAQDLGFWFRSRNRCQPEKFWAARPRLYRESTSIMTKLWLVFVADGRFHLEAFMIANPRITAFRYDPYIGSLFLEEYDHKGMKESRRNAIVKAREAKNWGIVLGTLGRQGNPRILDRLEKKMREKGLDWTVVLMSELSPTRIALFGGIGGCLGSDCLSSALSIDWGDAFVKPLLTPFEAEIALGDLPGWWERKPVEDLNLECKVGLDCSRRMNRVVHVIMGMLKKRERALWIIQWTITLRMEVNGILVTPRSSLVL
ncbi:diphthamide synthesis DPH2 family protein [Actinidia rufa]|uniref:2-(3-amino-3-carboxypropyl)histidine synthase subunit 1 n=1 Tax=Actinidia rufa TaxID=165716 RepID=A0A7J0GD30_9ERIC|nr:diphthamide synthesis DPH2 family protein [Actinidia rufa]